MHTGHEAGDTVVQERSASGNWDQHSSWAVGVHRQEAVGVHILNWLWRVELPPRIRTPGLEESTGL